MSVELLALAVIDPGLAMVIVMWLVLVFSVVVHECAHGLVALWRGDDTAYRLGRITLNPINHIDPFMTILLPAMLLLTSGGRFAFGGAKPVPVNVFNLRNPKRDFMFVSIAGPLSNILLAVLFALAANLNGFMGLTGALKFIDIMQWAAVINLVLAAFNMLPIPPLDGSRVLMWLLPDEQADKVASLSPFGMPIIMILLLAGTIGHILNPVIHYGLGLVRILLFWFPHVPEQIQFHM